MLFTADAQDVRDIAMCKEVGEALHEHYPGHAWAVYCAGGMLHIKNLRLSNRYGMALKMSGLTDANVRKRKVIRSAGEFLERAGWSRAGFEGQAATHLEGNDKFKAINGVGVA